MIVRATDHSLEHLGTNHFARNEAHKGLQSLVKHIKSPLDAKLHDERHARRGRAKIEQSYVGARISMLYTPTCT
jgi:hypothetical protein